MQNKLVKLNHERCKYKLPDSGSGKVFDSENDILHELNEEGTTILKLIGDGKTHQEILGELCSEYATEEKIIEELYISFITDAESLGIVSLV
jgi:hypothetical protein